MIIRTDSVMVTKKPWQMTEEEFGKFFPVPSVGMKYISVSGEQLKIIKSEKELGLGVIWRVKNLSTNKSNLMNTQELNKAILGEKQAITHRGLVYKALQKGKPVPPEVLKDYPDLMRQVKPIAKEIPSV